jgi:hypothetical protein
MALAGPVNVAGMTGSSTANTATYTTGAGVLTAGRKYLLRVVSYRSGGSQTPSTVVHDAGGTPLSFTLVSGAAVNNYDSAAHRHLSVWEVTPGADTASAAITITFPAGCSSAGWGLDYYTGQNNTGTFVQVVTNTGQQTAAIAVTMASFAASGNGTYLAMAWGDGTANPAETIAPTESRSELEEHNDAERSSLGCHYQTPNGSDTSIGATLSASTVDWGAIGIEIKEGVADTPINAEPGTHSVSGVAATMARAITMAALAGSLAISGAAATTQRAVTLNAEPGAYSVSGATITTLVGYVEGAGAGAYVVSGVAATTVYSAGGDTPINAEPGTYAVSGAAATTQRQVSADAQPGTYSVAGAAATTLVGYLEGAEPSTYTVSGAAATTQRGVPIPALPATYGVAGADATFLSGRVSVAEPTTYSVGGVAATTVYSATGVERYGSVQGWGVFAFDDGNPLKMGQRLGRSAQGAGPGADFPT